MIGFFRRIRKKLADDNQVIKYSRYAFGEIVLVMVGILLALQVNNWNEYRKDRIQEQEVLEQLKEEYESNLEQLDSKITMRKTIIASSRKLLKYIDDPVSVSSDSILYNLARGGMRPTYDPIKNDLVSSNKLSLIQNNKLRILLSQWESNYHQVNEEEWF
jgi:type II secretory pathway pseudopilin PulG